MDVLRRDYEAVLVRAQNVPNDEWSKELSPKPVGWSQRYSSDNLFISGPQVGVFLKFGYKQLKGENSDNLQVDITTRMCEGIEMNVAADYHEKAREVVRTVSSTLAGHRASDLWIWGYTQSHTFFGSEEQMLRAYAEAHPEARPA